MKKKLLTIVLSLAMLVTMIPAAAFAATVSPAHSTNQSMPKVEKIQGKYVIKHVDSTLEMYKQALIDTLDEEYATALKDKSEYSEEVWNKINSIYEAEMAHIDAAEDEADLLTVVWIFMIPNEETVKALTSIDCLAAMTKDKINAKTDYKSIKKDLRNKCKKQYEIFYKEPDYNAYYWSCIQSNYEQALDMIKKIKNLDSYLDALVVASTTEMFDPEFNVEDYGYLDDSLDILPDDNGDWGEEVSYLGIESFMIGYFGGYLSNSELEELKDGLGKYMDAYVNKQLLISEYAGDLKPLQKMVEDAKKQYADMYDGDEINAVFVKTCSKIEAETGIQMEVVEVYSEKLLADLAELKESYKEEDYSPANWSELSFAFMEMESEIEGVIYRASLPVDVIGTAKNVIDKIPTYKQELKALKSKYVKKLDKYVGNVKYNQTKAKPVVAEGKKAIKASDNLDEIEMLYLDYNKKAKETVKKYKITTVKVGKGTITKTKTVKYGKNATIKITPKAGYKISKVYIDGKSRKLKNSYTFKNVKKAHKVKVIFKK